MKTKSILTAIVTGFFLAGCVDGISEMALEATGLKGAPQWVINGGEGIYSGIGDAPIIKNNVQFARTEALAMARAEIAKQIETKINTYLQKNAQRKDAMISEEAKNEVKELARVDLIDSSLASFWISDDGSRVYVLVKLNEKTVAEIRKKLKNEQINVDELEISTP